MTAKRWRGYCLFLLTPLREGRLYRWYEKNGCGEISTHAPAGGATEDALDAAHKAIISTHAPAGGATLRTSASVCPSARFLLTPLREGRRSRNRRSSARTVFLLTPLREGRLTGGGIPAADTDFYSRPCGRGDVSTIDLIIVGIDIFLLTPLREGRRRHDFRRAGGMAISTHAPAGGATRAPDHRIQRPDNFYSRPCGRGDRKNTRGCQNHRRFLLTPLREGRLVTILLQ